jgi:hypothetical protein
MPLWVITITASAFAFRAIRANLFAASTPLVTSIVPKLPGRTTVGASSFVMPITAIFAPPRLKYSSGSTPVRLASRFFRFAET